MENQTSALSDTHIAAWARLVRSSQRILQKAEAELKAENLPPLSWYDLLLELSRVNPDGLRPFQLQSEMLIPQYNMSRLLDRIAKAGYVVQSSCENDKRGQIVRITDEGGALVRKMWPVYRRVLKREFADRINTASARQLSELLDRLRYPEEDH